MIRAGTTAMLLLVLGSGPDQRRGPPPREVHVRQQVVIRVSPPRARAVSAAGAPIVVWREGRGPRCIPIRQIVAAISPRQNSVDFLFRDNSRIRARLERRCPTIDFYRALYVQPTRDGLICAERDVIRSRTGGACEIDGFRSLIPSRG